MRNNRPSHTITLAIVRAAVQGDEQAIIKILENKDKTITARCTYTTIDEQGNTVRRLDEDMKSYVQMILIRAIQKYRELL